jgi:integrase
LTDSKEKYESDRYIRDRSGRSGKWFRRRVPHDVIALIGKPEWRFTLTARTQTEARREALPHLIQTNEIIELARRGDWPPMTDEQAEIIAHQWACSTPDGEVRGGESGRGAPAFPDRAAFTASFTTYIAEHWPILKPGTRNFEIVKGFARGECTIGMGWTEYDYSPWNNGMVTHLRGGEPPADYIPVTHDGQIHGYRKAGWPMPVKQAEPVERTPLPFDYVIDQWAEWKEKEFRATYHVRNKMRRLAEVVGFDDLSLLTKTHVEKWIKHLRDLGLASATVAINLRFLNILSNFAIAKDLLLTESPTARIKLVGKTKTKMRAYTNTEAQMVLAAARQHTDPARRWLPWMCCFTGCRLDEIAGAAARDIEQIGSYWVLHVRLDHRPATASLKNEPSERTIPLHPALIEEGFLGYWRALPRDGALFPELIADRFGSKAGTASKRIGPMIRGLADVMPSLADLRLSPSHSWRHRLHDECRRIPIRQDIEDAITGHAQEGSGPGYGEYAIETMLGPAIASTRSPFAVN